MAADLKQRVYKALSHQQPDKTPYNIVFTKPARAKMAEFYGDADFESKLGNCFTIIQGRPKHTWKQIKPDIWLDDFGTIWNRTRDKDIGVADNQLITPENVHDFEFPDPDDPARYELFEPAIQNAGNFVFANLGLSLFERSWILAGMENMLMAMTADKSFANALLDRILEFNLRCIENFCKFDIDGVFFGDDWAPQRGLIMGPALWRELIKPRVKQMYQLVKSKGKFVFIHSCGKVQQLFEDIIECGADVFNPFQPEVMDVFKIKRQYGDRLSFCGGLSIQRTLPFGTVEQVKDETRRFIDIIGKDGGYIASPSHAIPGDAKAENVAAMIEVMQNQ